LDALRKDGYQVREDASFRTYLYRVAENCRIDDYRRDNIRVVEDVAVVDCDEVPDGAAPGESETDPANDPVFALHQKRLLERFGEFLMSLSPEQRETAGLYLMGYSREEIAERAGVGTETVKSRIRYLEPKMEAWREQQRLELGNEYG
jgi:RNA polymerase sigma factor (sigma-70 family)